ncbi:LysR family transcriptional regulator [Robbsia sp. Bb-Pol-6]|uniref:LysR family transcriptional regulator n=1 Tax=Robbsia betulipollinis TaxID=2981849 RepID=A0ABT3ZR20_9BURK|nr:LysR family transcriptional regulator [Robbsia betulipollinis]MCY0388976.1 LysR family transcriptional regulator [Robbsia betulipollinis]
MELRHLQYFVTLANTLHFGRAAAKLHISQPPLSRQIALLEDELGVQLFNRSTRNVQLSLAGKQFLIDSTDILAAVERARRNALAAGAGSPGTLSVGFMFAAAYSVVPSLTRAYTSNFPDVELKLSESIPTLLIDDIRNGRTDVAIMYPPENSDGLVVRTVYREPLVAALPAGHALASRKSINVEDLRHEGFLISPRGASPYIYDTIVGHCKRSGFTPRIRLETNFQQTIVSLVGQHLGVALVHRSIQTARPAHVVFKPLDSTPIVEVALVWSRDNRNACIDTFSQSAERMWPRINA